MGPGRNIRQMPPREVLAESPDRLGLRISMVQTAVYADLAPRLHPLGFTSPSRLTALYHINANEGCSQTELAVFTGLSRASAMTMVNQLEEAGLVRRGPAQDSRTHALFLTERGRAAAEEGLALTLKNEEKIFGILSPAERAALKQLLEKLIGHVANTDRDTGTHHGRGDIYENDDQDGAVGVAGISGHNPGSGMGAG